MIRCLFCLLLLLTAGHAAAETILSGHPQQGGLVVGQTSPGAAVTLDGRAVRVAADGRFVIGFGREADSDAVLTITTAQGTETQRLTVAPREWQIQRIDGLPPAKVTPQDPKLVERIRAESALVAQARQRDTAEALWASGFVTPAQGRISGVFGSQRILNGQPRAPHSGTDIAAPTGAPVMAAGDGIVSLSHPDMWFTGVTVMVDHGHGLQSVYAHLHDATVRAGDRVTAGQLIGHVGATGRATGPHLHWGVSWHDVRLDPEAVMAVLGR